MLSDPVGYFHVLGKSYPVVDTVFNVSAVLYGVFFILAQIRAARFRSHAERIDDKMMQIFIIGWISSGGLGALMIVAVLASPIYGPTRNFVMTPWMGFVLIPVGIMLFRLKRNQTLMYGLLEIGAAVSGIAYASFDHQQSFEGRVTAFVGAVYFLVRGLDNLTKAEPIKTWASTKFGIKE